MRGTLRNATTAVIACSLVVGLACTLAVALRLPDVPTHREHRVVRPKGLDPVLDLLAQREAQDYRTWLTAVSWVRAKEAFDAARARDQAAARAARSSHATSTSRITGSCAAMKPPGFPDWIIRRESGGDPNARNPSGAYGCAQLMPTSGGTGTYAERWARLWANGAGACHWNPPDYCAG